MFHSVSERFRAAWIFLSGVWFSYWAVRIREGEEKQGSLAGFARAVVGGVSHLATCARRGRGGCEQKQPVMAEDAKKAKLVAPVVDGPGGSAVVQPSAAPAAAAAPVALPPPEPEKKVEEEQVDYSVDELLAQHQDLVDSLLAEGILDDQFTQLQMLQDESNPGFVEEVVTLFFDDSEKLLNNLTDSLKTDPIDYKTVDGHVHQFKGSSSSIGAQRVKELCIKFRICCENGDKQGCLGHLVKVKEEFNTVRTKLGKILELENQIVAKGGVLPLVEC
uniref:Histidine-containing phosphotransfer protein n=2 Tax=Physcomitrium patens TaxID=3218 RepID=A0A2K1L1D4_PHYPA|nr:hypothetical protein PHYPA_002630 [Physcomitrium patens]BCP96815.1 histidine-containing phosphotransfer 1 [Physcomitrium patens]